jgi:hypothetical protein
MFVDGIRLRKIDHWDICGGGRAPLYLSVCSQEYVLVLSPNLPSKAILPKGLVPAKLYRQEGIEVY